MSIVNLEDRELTVCFDDREITYDVKEGVAVFKAREMNRHMHFSFLKDMH